MKPLVVVILSMALIASSATGSAGELQLYDEQTQSPALVLPDLAGRQHNLDNYRGQVAGEFLGELVPTLSGGDAEHAAPGDGPAAPTVSPARRQRQGVQVEGLEVHEAFEREIHHPAGQCG